MYQTCARHKVKFGVAEFIPTFDTSELATYRSASLVTVCGDVCQTTESLLVSSPELAHLRTVYFALYKCTLIIIFIIIPLESHLYRRNTAGSSLIRP